MLVKRIIIAGFVSCLVLSLTAMESGSKKPIKHITYAHPYAHSWSTSVLVIKEFFHVSKKPKDIANLILGLFYRVHEEENAYWKMQLAKVIDIDKNRMHLDVMFFLNVQHKHGITLITNSLDLDFLDVDQLNCLDDWNYLTQKEYQESVLTVPIKVRGNFHYKSTMNVIEKKSKMKQILLDPKDTGQLSVLQSSLCGGAMGAVLYSLVKKTVGGCLSFPEFIVSTGIGTCTVGITSILNKWLKTRSLPQKPTFIECPLFSNEEFKKLLADKLLADKLLADKKLADKKLENMHCKMLNQLQKNNMPKNLFLQNRE